MFATAPDLAAFCQMLLNGGIYAHQRLLARATIAQFTTRQALAAGAGTLGWMAPTENSSSGRYFSANSFGHLGFTGASIWIDPDRKLFVILLTNRVHPTRANDKITVVRPAVHDAIVEALEATPSSPPAYFLRCYSERSGDSSLTCWQRDSSWIRFSHRQCGIHACEDVFVPWAISAVFADVWGVRVRRCIRFAERHEEEHRKRPHERPCDRLNGGIRERAGST